MIYISTRDLDKGIIRVRLDADSQFETAIGQVTVAEMRDFISRAQEVCDEADKLKEQKNE